MSTKPNKREAVVGESRKRKGLKADAKSSSGTRGGDGKKRSSATRNEQEDEQAVSQPAKRQAWTSKTPTAPSSPVADSASSTRSSGRGSKAGSRKGAAVTPSTEVKKRKTGSSQHSPSHGSCTTPSLSSSSSPASSSSSSTSSSSPAPTSTVPSTVVRSHGYYTLTQTESCVKTASDLVTFVDKELEKARGQTMDPVASVGGTSEGNTNQGTIPTQRMKKTLNSGVSLLDNTKKETSLNVGVLGEQTSGKSHCTTHFLNEELDPTTQCYSSVDVNAAKRLNDEQKKLAHKTYPAKAGAGMAETVRPTRYSRSKADGRVRVKCKAATPEQLRERVAAMSNADSLMPLIPTDPNDDEYKILFTDTVIYEGKNDNCWDDFHVALQMLNSMEDDLRFGLKSGDSEEEGMTTLRFLAWSYTEYDGPFLRLQQQRMADDVVCEDVLYDIPGVDDPDEKVRLLAKDCLKDMDVVLLVPKSRLLTERELNLLEYCLTKSVADTVQVILLYNVIKIQGVDEHMMWAKRCGGVKGFHEKWKLATVLRDALIKGSSTTLFPSLTGDYRLAVFSQMEESSQCVIHYDDDVWKWLSEAGLLKDIERSSTQRIAGPSALQLSLNECRQRKFHRKLIRVMNAMDSVCTNIRSTMNVIRRLNRDQAVVLRLAVTKRELRRKNLSDFKALKDELDLVEPSRGKDQAEFVEGLTQVLSTRKQAQLHATDDDRSRLATALSKQVFQLVHGVSEDLSDERVSETVRAAIAAMFEGILRGRVRQACRATYIALHVLLFGVKKDNDNAAPIGTLDDEEMDSFLDLLEESNKVSRDETALDAQDEKDVQEDSEQLKGHGTLNVYTKDKILRQLVAEDFEELSSAVSTVVSFFQDEGECRKRVMKLLTKTLKRKLAAINGWFGSGGGIGSNGDVDIISLRSDRELATEVASQIKEVYRYVTERLFTEWSSRDVGGWSLDSLSVDVLRYRYEEILKTAEISVDKQTQKDIANRVDQLKQKLQLKGVASKQPTVCNSISNAELLQETPNLLEREKGAQEDGPVLGSIRKLPVRESGVHRPGECPPRCSCRPLFDVKPVTPQLFSAFPSSSSASQSSKSSFVSKFISDPQYTIQPRRMLLDFENGSPHTGRMELWAYDGWSAELQACLSDFALTQNPGLAPIFMPTKGRATKGRVNKGRGSGMRGEEKDRPLARLDMSGEDGLELTRVDPDPQRVNRAIVYVVMEKDDAASYFNAFNPPPHNVVFVLIPGSGRGIRFARACILYLVSCLRAAMAQQLIPFDVYHTLDDDWRRPRAFDSKLVGERSMRPCTLYMVLKYQQKIMKKELERQDGRVEQVKKAMTDKQLTAALEDVCKRRGVNLIQLSQLLPTLGDAIIEDANHYTLTPAIAAFTNNDEQFRDAFLKRLRELKSLNQSIGQVAVNHRNNTSSINFNVVHFNDKKKYHYKVGTALSACVTHYQPLYEQEKVNYLATDEFFLPQQQVRLRCENLSTYEDYFISDHLFFTQELRRRGIGGLIQFAFDLDFANITVGGLTNFREGKKKGKR